MIRARLAAAIGVTAVILILIVLLFAMDSRLDLRTIERDQARLQAKQSEQAHARTIESYRSASAAAQQSAERNVARVAAEQAAITKGTVHDYQARLAAVDARYERVRAQLAARSDLRSPNLAPVSIASDATCRAYGGGDCDALLAKLAIAERQAENLVALRQWVRSQARAIVETAPAP
ncbi:hypothetical protein ACWGM0_05105 [Sphingomonas bisphenolicum]